jgi:L-asparagine transporter-like permease
VKTGQFPPLMSRRIGGHASVGLLVVAIPTIILAVAFDLNAIASIGSAVALVVFFISTIAHLRVRSETGARISILLLAALTIGIALATFVLTTMVDEPATAWTLLGILVVSIVLDLAWTTARDRRTGSAPPAA